MSLDEKEVQKWLDASPSFAQDEHNVAKCGAFLKARGESVTLAELATYINAHPAEFHWLTANAATKVRRPGGAVDRLFELGVPVSGQLSHADKVALDQERSKGFEDMRKKMADDRANRDREKQIRDARLHTEFRSDGRIDHAKTAEVRKHLLEELGLNQ